MDNEENISEDIRKSLAESVKTYITYVKIALAVVIIRFKPPNQSAEEFTWELISRHQRSSETDWKKECETLQQQIVLLQQELTVCRLGCAEQPSAIEANLEPNQLCYPTPPSSLKSVSGTVYDSLQKTSLFLQAVRELQANPNDAVVLFQSVGNVLEFCSDSLLKRCVPFPKVANGCLRLLLELSQKQLLPCDVLYLIDSFVAYAFQCIMESKTSKKHEYCQNILEALALLSRSDVLFDIIFLQTVMQIELCASTLITHSKDPANFNQPDFFENCFYLFQCMETLLLQSSSTEPIRCLNAEVTSKWKQISETSFFHLNEHFPLFVQYVWRIASMLVDTTNQ